MQVKFNQNWIITMSNRSTGELTNNQFSRGPQLPHVPGRVSVLGLLLVGVLLLAIGCEGPPPKKGGTTAPVTSSAADKSIPADVASMAHQGAVTNSDSIVLSPGDTVRLTFPGAENLNRVALIRRDGYVTLPLVGEFKAAGLRPREMEKQLLELYGPQLQTKEVSVAVESSAFPVYVTGAVLRPGKILSDRPLTALEAIMEAGGFDYTKANLKSIRVLRTREGRTEQYLLNIKRVLQGQDSQQFQLKPGDIVYVPEKFNFF